MNSLAWTAGQIGTMKPRRLHPGPAKIVETADVVRYGRERGLWLTSANVALRFGIAERTARQRLAEAEACGLVRKHVARKHTQSSRYEPL